MHVPISFDKRILTPSHATIVSSQLVGGEGSGIPVDVGIPILSVNDWGL